MKEEKMEEKILAYLLEECTQEEAFLIEKMCLENPVWQTEKLRLGQVLSLLETSVSQPVHQSLSENETKLTDEQWNKINSLLEKKSINALKQKALDKDGKKGVTKENNQNSKVLYWVPLTAAAATAIIAFWAKPPKGETREEIAVSSAEVENEAKDLNLSSHSHVISLREESKSKKSGGSSQDAKFSSSKATLALNNPTEVNEGAVLSLITTETQLLLKAGDKDLLAGSPMLKEGDSINQNTPSKDPTQKETSMDAAFASISLPANFSSLPAPETKSIEPKNTKSPSLSFSENATAELAGRRRTLSKSRESLNSLAPDSWFDLLKSPEESFLFNEKGDSLGKIKIIENFPGKFQFKRINWPNKNHSFNLLAGSYEIRLSQTKSGTLILKGEMVPLEDESKYEFEYSKAWELDKEENRNPISIEELNP